MRSAATGADARAILLASLAAAVSSFVILLLAARTLDPGANRQFLVFWAILFGAFGVLSGIQHETTRAVSASRTSSGTPVLGSALLLGLGAAALLLASAPLWAPSRLPGTPAASAAIIAIAAVAYAGHGAVSGAAAGSRRWGLYAQLMGAEAIGRLILVAAVLGAGLLPLPLLAAQAGTAAAALVWIGLILLHPAGRGTALTAVTDRPGRLLSRRLAAMLTAAFAAVLITGFPAIIDATSAEVDAGRVAALLLMLSLTRAPVMIPLQALQGIAITAFVARRDAPLRALAPVAGALLGITAALALLAAAFGPRVLEVIAPLYSSDPLTWAGLTVAGGAVAILTLTGTACLALEQHGVYAAGWGIAVVAAVGALLVPGPIEARTVAALLLGPALGIVVHLLALRLVAPRLVAPSTMAQNPVSDG